MSKVAAAVTFGALRASGVDEALVADMESRQGSTSYLCVCGCGVLGSKLIPASVYENASELRSMLMKLIASSRKLEDLCLAFSADGYAASHRFRLAMHHVGMEALPFIDGTPRKETSSSSFRITRVFHSSTEDAPRVAEMPTPLAPLGTPSASVLTSKRIAGMKRRLNSKDWDTFEITVRRLEFEKASSEAFYSAALQQADERVRKERAVTASLRTQVDLVRSELETFRSNTPLWETLSSFGKVGDSPALRWDKVRGVGNRAMVALTGLPSPAFLERLVDWIDTHGALTDAPLLTYARAEQLLFSHERAEEPAAGCGGRLLSGVRGLFGRIRG
jgi:hypothetical protein